MPVSADGFEIEATLRANSTWLARRATGERLVLKKIPLDCLRQGNLHPAIKLRLTRLRELPLKSFVNLLGVELYEGAPVLVCEYVEGLPLANISGLQRELLLRQAQPIVQELHRLGFVHGNIHGGNLILDTAGVLRLIDPSPLLHDDPSIDMDALRRLGNVATSRTEQKPDHSTAQLQRKSITAAIALSFIGIAIAAVAILLSRVP